MGKSCSPCVVIGVREVSGLFEGSGYIACAGGYVVFSPSLLSSSSLSSSSSSAIYTGLHSHSSPPPHPHTHSHTHSPPPISHIPVWLSTALGTSREPSHHQADTLALAIVTLVWLGPLFPCLHSAIMLEGFPLPLIGLHIGESTGWGFALCQLMYIIPTISSSIQQYWLMVSFH